MAHGRLRQVHPPGRFGDRAGAGDRIDDAKVTDLEHRVVSGSCACSIYQLSGSSVVHGGGWGPAGMHARF